MLGNFSNSNASNPTEWQEIKTNQQIKELQEAIEDIQAKFDALEDRIVSEDLEVNTASVNNIDVGNATISSAAVTDTLGVNHLQAQGIEAVQATIPILNGTTAIESARVNDLEVVNKMTSLNVGSISADNISVEDNLNLTNVNADNVTADNVNASDVTADSVSADTVLVGSTIITENSATADEITISSPLSSVQIKDGEINLSTTKTEQREVERNGTAVQTETEVTYYDENGNVMDAPETITYSKATIVFPIHYESDVPYYADNTEVESEYVSHIANNAIVVYNILENSEERFEFTDGTDASSFELTPERIQYPINYVITYLGTQEVIVNGTINLESPTEATKINANEIKSLTSEFSQASILDLEAYKIHGQGKLNVNPEFFTEDDWATVEVPEYKNAVVLLNGSYQGNKWTITITRAGKAGTVIYAADTIDLIKDISYEYSGRCRCRVKADEYVYYSIYTTEENPEDLTVEINKEAYTDYIFVSTTLNGYTFIAFGDNTLSMHFPGRFSADYINMGTAEFEDFTIDLAKINMLGLPSVYDDMGNVNSRSTGNKNDYIRVSNRTVTPPGSSGINYLEYQTPLDNVTTQSDVLVTEKAVAKFNGQTTNDNDEIEHNIKYIGSAAVTDDDLTVTQDLNVGRNANVTGTLEVNNTTTLKNNVVYENDGIIVENRPSETPAVTLYSDDGDTWYNEQTLETEYVLGPWETVKDITEISAGLYQGTLAQSSMVYSNNQGTELTYLKNTFVDVAEEAQHSEKADDAINAEFATKDQNGDTIDTTYIKLAEKGVANGVASLDATGRLPKSQLPVDDLTFEGMWDAATNTPTLADGTGTKGDFYIVEVAGDQDLGSGTIHFNVNDRVIYDGTVWVQLKAGTVDSVNGVLPQNGNVAITGQDIPISSTSTKYLTDLFVLITNSDYNQLVLDGLVDPEVYYMII